jgi:hypothetical protein
MTDATPGSIQRRMLEDAKYHVRESGQFRTAQGLAKIFSLDFDDLQSRLKKWETRRENFSIDDVSTGELFAVFAFDQTRDLRPHEAISQVLDIFGNISSKLLIASWFIAANSYLDDKCPKDLLEEDPEWVIEAARDAIAGCTHG